MSRNELAMLHKIETLESIIRDIRATFPWPSDYDEASDEHRIMRKVYDYYDKYISLDSVNLDP